MTTRNLNIIAALVGITPVVLIIAGIFLAHHYLASP